MIEKFKDINSNLINKKWLLAISGGIDSMVLLHICHKLKLNFSIAHCNFKLRENESDKDHYFVEDIAKTYNVPFYFKTFNTEKESKSKTSSIQMVARELRYNWFEELLATHQYDFICTAHHRNDSVETTLLNLTKGATVKGLRGIAHLQKNILRPIINFSKEEIKIYQKKHKIAFREDASNSSDKYQRNFIRNKIIPLLEELNPNLVSTISENSDIIKAQYDCLTEHLNSLKVSLVVKNTPENEIHLYKKKLIEQKKYSLLILFHILNELHFSKTQIRNIHSVLSGEVGKEFSSNTHTLLLGRSKLFIIRKNSIEKPITICENLKDLKKLSIFKDVQIISNPLPKPINYQKNKLYIDYNTLNFPLILRPWKNGDRFQPLGIKGTKKISDILIDIKVTPLEKKKTYLLTDKKNTILWLANYRINECIKVTSSTKELLVITL